MTDFNATLFKYVREQTGNSQKSFAELIGVKQAVISKYETGFAIPSEDVFVKLTEQTGYPKDFFFQPVNEIPCGMVFHRTRASLKVSDRMRIEAEARLRAMDIMTICSKGKIQSEILQREGRSPKEMAEALRVFWNLGKTPIKNLTALLDKHRIFTIFFDFHTDKLDGFFIRTENDVICIALNSNNAFSPDRQRFTSAHELGHAILHMDAFPDNETEEEANIFAAEFLMPEEQINIDLNYPLTQERLRELKKKWGVSMSSLVFRARKLNIISENTYRRICIYFSSTGLRKKEPDCGLQKEISYLTTSLIREYAQNSENILNDLNLTQKRFQERYPDIKLRAEENSVCVS